MAKKKNEHRGPTWQGLFTRKTKTLKEKKLQEDKKRKQKGWED